jgi:hypothetical protein
MSYAATELSRNSYRIDIQSILKDPVKRRELMISCIMAMQEHEGRDADREKAEIAYDAILKERDEPDWNSTPPDIEW